FAPFPYTLAILAWFIHPALAPWIAAAVFWVWRIQLFDGIARIPTRTILLFFLVSALSASSFYAGWSYGIRFQGQAFTMTTSVLSGCLGITSGLLLCGALLRPSFGRSVLAHCALFTWTFSYAFTYLGEFP